MRQAPAFLAAAALAITVGTMPGPASAQGIDFDHLMDQAEEMWDNTGRALEEMKRLRNVLTSMY